MSHINGIGSSQQFPAATNAVATPAASRTAKSDAGALSVGAQTGLSTAGADKANVSGTANIVAQALSGSDVRMDRVATLQGAIAAGTYSVPAFDVATKLLSSMMN